MLAGNLVRLRAPQRADIPMFVKWFNDPETTRYLLRTPPMGMEEEEAWYDSLIGKDMKVFSIETLEGRLVGNVGIIHVDWANRNADIGIIIGEKECWSMGYGTEAITLLLGYMFDELNLERVWLYCDMENLRAQRCYEKCGLRTEGVFRHHRLQAGKFRDDAVMSILKQEWLERKAELSR
ncbi:MAG TPA: GNAT family protein [Methanomassiliicoccales archaeon]|nr:GNAT family protein [Methanomassiliicoccales archaeon]